MMDDAEAPAVLLVLRIRIVITHFNGGTDGTCVRLLSKVIQIITSGAVWRRQRRAGIA